MKEKRKIFLSQREFWNQVKKNKRERERERAGERKREWSPWNVLKEEEKENKRRG